MELDSKQLHQFRGFYQIDPVGKLSYGILHILPATATLPFPRPRWKETIAPADSSSCTHPILSNTTAYVCNFRIMPYLLQRPPASCTGVPCAYANSGIGVTRCSGVGCPIGAEGGVGLGASLRARQRQEHSPGGSLQLHRIAPTSALHAANSILSDAVDRT